jgi:hypothetical protein
MNYKYLYRERILGNKPHIEIASVAYLGYLCRILRVSQYTTETALYNYY